MINKKEIKKLKPLKKKHTGLKIFLIVLCVILVLPIAFVFGAFYDSSTKNVSDTEVHYENIVSEAFYKGLEKLDPTNPKLSFTINEEMIDGIMMGACDQINQKTWIPKMYCMIKENDYIFVADLQAYFFKTRVLISTTLDKDGEGFEETLTFNINKITVGRLPLPLSLITGVLGNFLNDDVINNAFAQSKFHIKSHLSEGKLTYDRKTFKEDVGNYILESGKDNPYLDLLLNMIGDKEHQVLTTDYKNGVTATFNLDQLELPTERTLLNFPDLNKHATEMGIWLDANYLEEGNVDEMFTYLIRGYNLSDSDVQNYINNLESPFKEEVKQYINLGGGSFELNTYTGSKVDINNDDNPDMRFEDYCGDGKINADFEYKTSPISAEFSVETDSLNKYLAKTMDKAIGKTIPITYTDEENKWHCNYILVDNLYVRFIDDEESNKPKMVMILTLNIGGVQLGLELLTNNIEIPNPTADSFGNLSFNLEKVYFGLIPVEDKSVLDTILGMIPSEGNTFMYKDNHFLINLDDVLTGIPYKNEILRLLTGQYGTPSVDSDIIDNDLNLTYTVNP